jgi:RNA polymerase sigma-70 factor (ECF subfamily)
MVVTGSEFDLVEACRAGDREAFRELFETYKDKVYSIALRFSGEAASASDITQDTFVKLFSRIAEFRGDSSFDSWLYRVVVNACLDHRRRGRKWAPLLEQVAGRFSSASVHLDEQLARNQTRERVRAAVAALEPELRMVVVLRYTEGLSYQEIAEAFGCPPGTVASRLNRAHRDLAKKLSRMGIGGC